MAKKTTQVKTDDKATTEGTSLIIAPRITEKASVQSNANAYTFIVKDEATKVSLLKEIKATYKVTPKAINILNNKSQNVFVRGKWGKSASMKKAIVFLKKGDTINLAN